MIGLIGLIFARGFFADSGVQVALAVGAGVAVVGGVVGVFTVMRGQSFAGHAIADLGATGGAAAVLIGVGPLWGFLAIGIAAAGTMELIGIQRPRGRDLATGIVLGAGLGLAALFLYLDSTYHSTSGATVTILFGSVFAISPSTIPIVIVLGLVAVGLVGVTYRPLLLSSISPEIAAARGLRVRVIGMAFLLALAIAVSLAAVTIGAILSTALLVGPAAAALRLTKRPGVAILTASAIGLGATWLGIVLAYDSYDWPPVGHGWPVSFFVVVAVFVSYLLAGLPTRFRRVRRAGLA
ncbi:MAG: zinc/manganese transport system permease protein [Solirubrobacteraceae bacterium]|jgi:zinc/manganese transport system permease protein|nr:zinc/manganese transport system permease protein [Solirubrobacteraceae bacterium]